ncbi:hypothetical protein [Corynebacterium lowii]|uniref:Four helix bundle sensory module for signal transduction n=1 Tax=Corynebacterium lowii TaxID=1544413 RepID=A0A0Q1E106_9CORY|nr:hypothetical protein [Corynebacterium lowii]KQB86150.1 hypothetical protein Clow_01504 [Corynebacterium lowii]MDP9852625.1 hypothetical protein [Corynebacterium lowii]
MTGDAGHSPKGYLRQRLRGPWERALAKRKAPLFNSSELPHDTEDHWLDRVDDTESTPRNSLKTWWITASSGPLYRARVIWRFISTTPGKMVTLTIILAAAIFAAGYSMSDYSAARQQSLTEMLDTTEPTSSAAHNLYTSLSLADTMATTGMVQSGVMPEESLSTYYQALDRASTAASEVAAGIGEDAQAAELIARVQRQLPVYAGLVETSRSNNRQGNPVSVSYMAEASALMRDEILEDASAIFDRASHNVSAQQYQAMRPQWVPLSGLIAAVIFLLIAQWWLWRITRRRLNKGFLAATAMMFLAILWVSGSNFATWQAGNRSFEQAALPWDSLTTSRISAQQARTTETLALVRRQSIEDTNSSFEETARALSSALDDVENAQHRKKEHSQEALDSARTALSQWEEAHAHLVSDLRSGEFSEALRLTTNTSEHSDQSPTTAGAFNDLDEALGELIGQSRTTMRSFIRDGLGATTLVSVSVLLLSLGSIVAVVLGIRPRLQEYL